MKGWGPVPCVAGKHPIQHQRVHVHVEVQRRPESLHNGHPSTRLGMALSKVEGPRRRCGHRPRPAPWRDRAGPP